MTQQNSSPAPDFFQRVRFIMVHPSHPGNVGAAARAIKTMGFHELCLVAPRHVAINRHEQALAMSSGAEDVLANAPITATLEQALAPVTLAFALTARPRDLGPPPCDIRSAAHHATDHLQTAGGNTVAFVLGTERTGLSNAHAALCQRICHIPANPAYSSLNVAQAAQLTAWELHYALASAAQQALLPDTQGAPDPGSQPATSASVQGLIDHLEQALTEIGFLDPDNPRKLMLRMRHLLMRCNLSRDETSMLRGVCTAILKTARKHTVNR